MELKEAIEACLAARGWTVTQLAEASHVPIPCISRVRTGERKGMHSSNLLKLAPFLNLQAGGALKEPACPN
ncbi:hypothetical protein JCM15519_07300 [Fundidesulfovibrio butyratiphilus]